MRSLGSRPEPASTSIFTFASPTASVVNFSSVSTSLARSAQCERSRFASARRTGGRYKSAIGIKLARTALGPGGPLVDPNLDTGEQRATADLFAGALGVFKNPPSHRQVQFDDPTKASEVILFADLLLRMSAGSPNGSSWSKIRSDHTEWRGAK